MDDEEREIKRRKRKMWVDNYLENRETFGFFAEFNTMLRQQNPKLFKNTVRMNVDDFNLLAERVRPFIQRQDTQFRKAISVEERLAVTLRYLATGESMASLRLLFKIADSTISLIIHETCAAIYSALRGEYLKVNIFRFIHFIYLEIQFKLNGNEMKFVSRRHVRCQRAVWSRSC